MPEGTIPADVERYVEEGKAQGMDEKKAWAVAWSRYCKYKNPGSSHCKKSPNEYFAGRKASEVDGEIEHFLSQMKTLARRQLGIRRPPRERWEPEGDVVNVVWDRGLTSELYRDVRDQVVAYIPVPGTRRIFTTPQKAIQALQMMVDGRQEHVRMASLRKNLIRLAHQNPDLRPHLLPIIKESTVKVARGIVLRDPECMLSWIDPRDNKSRFYEMVVLPAMTAPRAKRIKDFRRDKSQPGWALVRRWGRLTDSGGTGRVDSMNAIFDTIELAERGYAEIYREKTRKGYKDYVQQGEYPVGLGPAGYGWGGQAICKIIPEVRAFRDELDRIDGKLQGLMDRLRPIARQDSDMARNLQAYIRKLRQDVGVAESYIDTQLAECSS